MEMSLKDMILSLVAKIDDYRFNLTEEEKMEREKMESDLEGLEDEFFNQNGFYLNY